VALANQPTLLGPFLGWAAALALSGVLSKRDHELLAMRASYNCRSAFEWGEHAVDAAAAGLSDAEIDRIAVGPDAPGWSTTEAALLRAADELHAGCRISDATWGALAAAYGPAELVEILFVIGQYTMLSMVAEGAGIPADENFLPLPG
jgi:alkylhydroperoxidase family enzyme